MIVGMEGVIERCEQTWVHINLHGVIYEVHISLHTSHALSQGQRAKLLITQIIREDAHLLYGFLEGGEQYLFDTVLKINGVGPKVALAICSTFTPESFSRIIASKDVAMLKRVPGIGPKAASRILVELADFIVDSGVDNAQSGALSEATMALESLGFGKDAIIKALRGASGDTSSLVKEGLRKLQRL
jgi:Holliday junction DNA helicase RuvA